MFWLSCLLAGALLQAEPEQAKPEALKLLPEEIVLSGPRATQRLLLVEAAEGGESTRDWTDKARFVVADPAMAAMDGPATIAAVSDGSTTLSAQLPDGRKTSVRIRVLETGKSFRWSFRNHVLPALTKAGCNSGPCHGAGSGQNYLKLSLRGYAPEADHAALTRAGAGRRVLTLQPARSLMLLKPTLAVPHGGGRRLTVPSRNYQVLSEWIATGAAPPQPTDRRVASLRVIPPRLRLQAGQRHGVLVQAVFDDGSREDVTHWAKYSSTDSGILNVDETGGAQAVGRGEAYVSVWCLDQVASARVTIPLADGPGPDAYARAPRHNWIDDLVLEKLSDLRLPPYRLSNDHHFVRRAHLDAIGVLPTIREARRFVRDTNPDKRNRLIESLLSRPEFVDYWTYKWCDLLLVSSSKLKAPSYRIFYDWLRRSVAENMPWDRFVREIVTATGSNYVNGAANYWVMHDEATKATENITHTFLGISVACARCHNHPLDKWTQEDYYGLSSFFSRVGRKPGDRGDVIIFESRTGEVPFPGRQDALPPRPLEGKPMAENGPGSRREHFADWLTSPENRYFLRATVNRVWHHFLGRGLVEPVDDLRQTNPASNEDLMDALVRDFTEHGFDLRHVIRTIMKSATYQASAGGTGPGELAEKYHSRFRIRRLPAEVILDMISQVAAVPERFPGFPSGTRALQLPDTRVASNFLSTFGRPAREINAHAERVKEPTVNQALHLIHGEGLHRKLQSKTGLLSRSLEQGLSRQEVIRKLYWAALSRPPTDEEMRELVATLGPAQATSPGRGITDAEESGLVDLALGILTSKEFLFNH